MSINPKYDRSLSLPHRRYTVRVTARQMYRLAMIVREVAAELETLPRVRLVGCEVGRWHDHSLRTDLVARLTYEVPPSSAVTERELESRAFGWVEGPADLRGYENIRAFAEATHAAQPAN